MSRSLLEVPSCSTASAELKLYRAFIFSIPIFFTFFLLLLFYLYLHCTRADRSSLQIRHNTDSRAASSSKELRELLPVIVFKESFSARDMQFSCTAFSISVVKNYSTGFQWLGSPMGKMMYLLLTDSP
ncbi:RING-H2 finger protein ATL58-like isoform X3 [Malania oleifera]|uniref:RING-H2 finger protein ATL58-like isoform X3 n=1 Tax=Malania oleifera TaxID=397392 RepID=UPI0025AE32D3|nr:RING-H2 finger protein ATL58-like isoform X3 [Malania oleifera]